VISVIIPLYNKEKYILKTLQSVLAQTYTAFEVIIVNDGSTDRSMEVVSAISDQRLKIITLENSGVSVARNTGIKAAEYDWVSFLDGDDYWAPTFLEEIVAAIVRFPEKKIFASGRSRIFQGHIERYRNKYLPGDGETKVINYYKVISRFLPMVNSSNAVIKRSHFDLFGLFRPGQRQHEDHDLWLRLTVNEPVVFVNKELSYYRKTDDNTASQDVYPVSDFSTYLSTMLEVKQKISEEEKKYYRQYYTRFSSLVYLKYKQHYSKVERQQISVLLKELLGHFRWVFLKFIGFFPLYSLYKLIKKGDR
jgi:glycosyltransferase involved in cell wall biosynthesis